MDVGDVGVFRGFVLKACKMAPLDLGYEWTVLKGKSHVSTCEWDMAFFFIYQKKKEKKKRYDFFVQTSPSDQKFHGLVDMRVESTVFQSCPKISWI